MLFHLETNKYNTNLLIMSNDYAKPIFEYTYTSWIYESIFSSYIIIYNENQNFNLSLLQIKFNFC